MRRRKHWPPSRCEVARSNGRKSSKIRPNAKFVSKSFLQSLFDIPCSIRFQYFSVFVCKCQFCGCKLTDFEIYTRPRRAEVTWHKAHCHQIQIQIVPLWVCNHIDWLPKTMVCSLAGMSGLCWYYSNMLNFPDYHNIDNPGIQQFSLQKIANLDPVSIQ